MHRHIANLDILGIVRLEEEHAECKKRGGLRRRDWRAASLRDRRGKHRPKQRRGSGNNMAIFLFATMCVYFNLIVGLVLTFLNFMFSHRGGFCVEELKFCNVFRLFHTKCPESGSSEFLSTSGFYDTSIIERNFLLQAWTDICNPCGGPIYTFYVLFEGLQNPKKGKPFDPYPLRTTTQA